MTMLARVLSIKTFSETGADLDAAVAALELAVQAWLDDAGEAQVDLRQYAIDGLTATMVIWYKE